MAELIWAGSIGKTEIRFEKENFCVNCDKYLDNRHIKDCSLFRDINLMDGFIEMLRLKNIREWKDEEI